jgi:hypothetical protein
VDKFSDFTLLPVYDGEESWKNCGFVDLFTNNGQLYYNHLITIDTLEEMRNE